jgi:hypothetical protein
LQLLDHKYHQERYDSGAGIDVLVTTLAMVSNRGRKLLFTVALDLSPAMVLYE